MATNKPISTISYNTEEFLHNTLESWVSSHLIQCYMYIHHKGEDGDKDHFHVRIEPNRRLDKMDLTAWLKEPDPNHSKPLGCRPWRDSKEEDWFLYVIHDPQYLKIKYADSKDGKIQYPVSDIVTSEGYDTEIAVLRARQAMENHTACIVKQLRQGKRVMDLIEEGKDVFRTTAVLKTLQATEYEKEVANNLQLTEYVNKLEKAIKDAGFRIIEVNGKLILDK